MEFYLCNKDDRKSKTLVNLATTFKINDVNYIVYYNTQVEKSVIDIYIGKISYGDQCLVINKLDSDKQGEFLNVIKGILASNPPQTEFGDYDNIIDTATIVLEGVQKIQIPTSSLELVINYHKKENFEPVSDLEQEKSESNDEINLETNGLEQTNQFDNSTYNNVANDSYNSVDNIDDNNVENDSYNNVDNNEFTNDDFMNEFEMPSTNSEINNTDIQGTNNIDSINDMSNVSNDSFSSGNLDESIKENIDNSTDSNNQNIGSMDSDNFINSNDQLSNLDNLLKEKEQNKKPKKNKKISSSLLILMILVILISIILYVVANYLV